MTGGTNSPRLCQFALRLAGRYHSPSMGAREDAIGLSARMQCDDA